MRTLRKPLQVIPVAMDGRFLAAVLDELDTAKDRAPCERREYERTRHRCLTVVLIVKEAGHDMAFMVATRNVSPGGVSLLHRHRMCPGEPCTVVFPLRHPNHVFVAGRTVRCRHVRGLLHEIGVRFDQPIPAGDFVGVLEHGQLLLRPGMERTGTQPSASS